MAEGSGDKTAGSGSEPSPVYIENPSETEAGVDQQVLDLISGEDILDLKLMEESDSETSAKAGMQAATEQMSGDDADTLNLGDLLETTSTTAEYEVVGKFLGGAEPVAEAVKVADVAGAFAEDSALKGTDFDAAFANAQFSVSYDIDQIDPLLDDSNLSVSDS